ncbi:uncharacterized protein LOC141607474 [Silene latifolia]|uniref:uncharacterized protein LOC141607474 n=1 Tax=Silene latifolia TaxID=37657 RepID=UPI003D778855
MKKPSQETLTLTDKSFIFKTQQARKLKLALSTLFVPEFNLQGLGRIDVDDKGLHVTVWNVESRVLGSLNLLGSDCEEFVYNNSFTPKMVNLIHIIWFLALAADYDTLTIYHLLDSDQLSFVFGNDPPTKFSVKLLEPNSEFLNFPVITGPCGLVLPSQDLRQMIPWMIQAEKLQNVKMTEKNVNITVGTKEWRYEGDEIQVKRWKGGKEFSQCFQWPHCDLLMNASYLSKMSVLCFLNDPPDTVMFRFSVTPTWDLSYITCSPKQHPSEGKLEKKPSKRFSFQMLHLGQLRQALESLTDRKLCQSPGLGLIQVSQDCCDSIMRNSETDVIGLVRLVKTGLNSFRCNIPLPGKMINLKDIIHNLSLAPDTDVVAVQHIDGSNEINFKTGILDNHLCSASNVRLPFAVELVEMDGMYRGCQYDVAVAFTLEIQYGFVSISIGAKSWFYDYDEQMINLKDIIHNLSLAPDTDAVAVAVQHIDGSNEINFKTGILDNHLRNFVLEAVNI